MTIVKVLPPLEIHPLDSGNSKVHLAGETMPKPVPVIQYTLDGKFIKKWPSAAAAGSAFGKSRCAISACTRGLLKSASGYIWLADEEGKTPEQIIKSHGSDLLGKKTASIPVLQYSVNGEFIARWPSASAAAKSLGGASCLILRNANSRGKTAYGYVWKLE